jgi:hypothetical protein
MAAESRRCRSLIGILADTDTRAALPTRARRVSATWMALLHVNQVIGAELSQWERLVRGGRIREVGRLRNQGQPSGVVALDE